MSVATLRAPLKKKMVATTKMGLLRKVAIWKMEGDIFLLDPRVNPD